MGHLASSFQGVVLTRFHLGQNIKFNKAWFNLAQNGGNDFSLVHLRKNTGNGLSSRVPGAMDSPQKELLSRTLYMCEALPYKPCTKKNRGQIQTRMSKGARREGGDREEREGNQGEGREGEEKRRR